MRTNKKLIVIAGLAACLLAVSSAVVFASGAVSVSSWKREAKAPVVSHGEYDSYLSKATTEEQRDALHKLMQDSSLGVAGEWKRDALIIIGELPKDAKRIQLEDAERIVRESNDQEPVQNAFNKIAGAPDWEGGSGIHKAIYFIDNNRKEGISVMMYNSVIHFTTNSEGVQKTTLLTKDGLLHEPKPTSSPKK